jgi:uncharacterized protein YutE (UPF0331/DUF86 family)
MMRLNIEKIYAKFRDIMESIGRLRALRDISLNDFMEDRDKRDIASFRLIVATEAAIDMCLHVAARMLKQVPEEYAGCFSLLSDHGIIDKDLSIRLGKMARFRNLLVHQYWEIDYSRMYEIICGVDLEDFEEFVRQIEKLIQKNIDAGQK